MRIHQVAVLDQMPQPLPCHCLGHCGIREDDDTFRVFKINHDIPICESVSPNSSYRWHSMDDKEYQAYLNRLESEKPRCISCISETETSCKLLGPWVPLCVETKRLRSKDLCFHGPGRSKGGQGVWLSHLAPCLYECHDCGPRLSRDGTGRERRSWNISISFTAPH